MPISGNATYLPTADFFLAHWSAANTALGAAGPVVTSAGVLRTGLVTQRAAVEDEFIAVTGAFNTVELSRATLAARKDRLRVLILAFNEAVRGRLAATAFPAALPAAPGVNDSAATTTQAGDDVVNLWNQIDDLPPGTAFTAPLLLRVAPDGNPEGNPVTAGLEQFNDALADAKSAATVLRNAEQNLALARDTRDRAKKRLYDILRDYRAAVAGFFPAADPIRESLPALNPPPGSTPDPVTATGTWDPAVSQGRLSCTASADPALDSYDLRYSPGPEYSAEDETTVASAPAAGPLEFLTTTGLTQPGATALFRIYVITATGNERGSNTVAITRPPAG